MSFPSGIPNFSRANVLVVGDVMLDSYLHGSAFRISPEAPVPVVHVKSKEKRLGGAGNVAVNAAALGAHTTLLALAGSDEGASDIEAMLAACNIDCHLQRVPGSETVTKIRILAQHQQLIRLDFEDNFVNWDASALLATFISLATKTDIVVLSDYAKGTLRNIEDLIAGARALGKPVIVDPKGTDFERYRGATVITPNLAEFEAVVGVCASESEIVARGSALREELDLHALLVTRSEKGMTLLAHGHEPVHLPTQAREVFDVTGAGDTVVAALAATLATGHSLLHAVSLSNAAASVVVAKLGTSTVSSVELARAVGASTVQVVSRGVLSEAELRVQMELARARGERLVMTNGCFDILHSGHVSYLKRAKALGDRLIVAVNDDDSVRRLKGESRPVNELTDRMNMLAALDCIDWVVSFSEDTPESLYCRLLPDVLVKGGDYFENSVAGGDCVRAAGGSVQIIDFLPGYSTTGLVKKMKSVVAGN